MRRAIQCLWRGIEAKKPDPVQQSGPTHRLHAIAQFVCQRRNAARGVKLDPLIHSNDALLEVGLNVATCVKDEVEGEVEGGN